MDDGKTKLACTTHLGLAFLETILSAMITSATMSKAMTKPTMTTMTACGRCRIERRRIAASLLSSKDGNGVVDGQERLPARSGASRTKQGACQLPPHSDNLIFCLSTVVITSEPWAVALATEYQWNEGECNACVIVLRLRRLL